MDGYKFIDKLGFEVECGVEEVVRLDGFDTHEDGSVDCEHSRPIEYVVMPPITNIVTAQVLLDRVYSRIEEINNSMGYHIHISMKYPYHIPCLASMKFQDYYKHHLRKTKLWNSDRVQYRWNEMQEYTAPYERFSDISAQLNGGFTRYAWLNFNSFYDHGTIEFRHFPAFQTANRCMMATQLTLDVVESYLNNVEYRPSIKEYYALTKKDLQPRIVNVI